MYRLSISHACEKTQTKPPLLPLPMAKFVMVRRASHHMVCLCNRLWRKAALLCIHFLLFSSRTDSVAFFDKEEGLEERKGRERERGGGGRKGRKRQEAPFRYAVCIQDQNTSNRACKKPTTLNTPSPLLLPCIPPFRFPIAISQQQTLPNALPLQLAFKSPILFRPFLQPLPRSAPIQ